MAIEYPNREKSSSKATKAVVVLLLLVSTALVVVVTVGGWEALQGAKPLQIGYILLYLLCAYFILRWRSGVLPVVAALATVLLIFAAIAGPEWFSRDKDGFDDPALGAGVLGLITLLLVPVQVLLVAFAMSGFRQNWQTEVERDDEDDRDEDRGYAGAGARTATA